ncbi:helix-turn-helix transcriptional regulator [Nocardioides sp. R-C-SC26]|uniref:helix-turn-helix domain-containing protein n=1 Tax=Nocardioides sp. R-C-SC26 TaxID=2870414 RepID=UPI001E45BD19|nr:helix-turn-helix domain-containing protein [Nocardioides sp. R-C-SC26]
MNDLETSQGSAGAETGATADLTHGHSAFEDDAVEIRRDGPLAALVAGVAAIVAVAYLQRAVGSAAPLDWVITLGAGAIAVLFLLVVLDSRLPLLVVDGHGLRLRRGRAWTGLAWSDVARVEHQPREALLRDGRISVVDVAGERSTVRLSMSTRLIGANWHELTEALREFTADAVEVVEKPGIPTTPVGVAQPLDVEIEQAEAEQAEIEQGAVEEDGTAPWDGHAAAAEDDAAIPAAQPAAPVAEPTQPLSWSAAGFAAPEGQTDDDAADDGSDDEDRWNGHGDSDATAVRPPLPGSGGPRGVMAALQRRAGAVTERIGRSDASEELDATAVRSAADEQPTEQFVAPSAVIGPELAAARLRLGLRTEQLAERTRIRVHVIEAIEEDDFALCGGDFYARGHLRTLARVLGLDAEPLIATYDERYADAPIDPRCVFEAELATGQHGAIRGTRGGVNWSVLVASVMAVVLVWSIARLVMDSPAPVTDQPVLNGSPSGSKATLAGATAKVPVSFTAETGGARVIVRDGRQRVVFNDDLAFMQTATLNVVPPVRIRSSDGGLTVVLDGERQGALGATGEQAQQLFVP